MAKASCSITITVGLKHARRAVAFLSHPASFVDGVTTFEALSVNSERHYRRGFDLWLGNARRPKRYHGFDHSEYKGKYTRCFTFKNVDAGERFYGFLCRPKTSADPHFEMCVLVCYAKKKRDETDPTQLERAEKMRKDPLVLSALTDPNLFMKGVGKNI